MGVGSRQRVLDALNMKIPDKVPYMHSIIQIKARESILGHPIKYDYPEPRVNYAPIGILGKPAVMEPADATDVCVAEKLQLDAMGMRYYPPFYAKIKESDGEMILTDGMITGPEVMDQIILPNPDDFMEPMRKFCERYKGEYALYAKIRLGVSFILNSFGLVNFSNCICDEPDFIHELLGMYTDWVSHLIDNLQECGVDFLWAFDDLAFKSGIMFSPATWDEFFAPHLKKSVSHIHVPWIYHTDGNFVPLFDKMLELGMNGIHPLEPGAVDVDYMKREYGKKVCLIGNIDIDHILTDATKEEVFAAVEERINRLGQGGGYIISDANSIPNYCSGQNVIWMSEAVQKFRNIY